MFQVSRFKFHLLPLFLLFLPCAAQADNWMSRLPDDAYVSVLSIPGSHDSATGSGWAEGMEDLGEAFARTQDLTIAQQWTLGIRAFDLRPCSYEDRMNLNHGIIPTVLSMEGVLAELRDSLAANPSEFVIIHMRHESEGDQVENVFDQRIQSLLRSDDFQGLFVDFNKALRVRDMRGKILVISRDKYASAPIGGFFQNWTGEANWNKQQQLKIVGSKSSGTASGIVQDYSETWQNGALQTKVDAINKLLTYSTTHKTTSVSSIRWIFNFASAFARVESLFGYNISTSDGYRDNASVTHAAILDFLQTHDPGPTGVILMDYVGVESSNGFSTRGREVVETIIQNNFLYLPEPSDAVGALPVVSLAPAARYTLNGQPASARQGLFIETRPGAQARKVLLK